MDASCEKNRITLLEPPYTGHLKANEREDDPKKPGVEQLRKN